LKKILILTAAFVAAVGVFVTLTIQPRRLQLAAPAEGTIRGAIHIHTSRSDGSSGPDEIAAAAARAGLKFVVFTDHGDGTRKPDPPAYRSGVLCLDGVEISTTGGHYIALDMQQAPYPLGGEARDVVEDVRRLGGFGIVAHPDSPKRELSWREWTAPFDAIEMVNPDTGWRVQASQPGWRPKLHLLAALTDYPFRPAETITGLLSEDTAATVAWARLARERRIVTVAGTDAHAKLALRSADPAESRFALPLPGYEPSFRVLSVQVRPDRPLSGDAADDGRAIVQALRAGHAHTIIDGIATPGSLEFTAANSSGTATQGDELQAGGPVTLRVRTNAPPSFTATVRDGMEIVSGNHHDADFSVTVSENPAVYWVDIRSADPWRNRVWARSNAIYVRAPAPSKPPDGQRPVAGRRAIFDGTAAGGWGIEHDPTSVAALDLVPATEGNELRFRFGLSDQITPTPAVALSYATPDGIAAHDHLTFTARAQQPMRISVQLRAAGEGAGYRWQRSVFIDVADEDRTVAFSDFRPIAASQPPVPSLAAIRSIMFVVDPVNTKRGMSSRLWFRRAAFLSSYR
jgi:hypothetical protein